MKRPKSRVESLPRDAMPVQAEIAESRAGGIQPPALEVEKSETNIERDEGDINIWAGNMRQHAARLKGKRVFVSVSPEPTWGVIEGEPNKPLVGKLKKVKGEGRDTTLVFREDSGVNHIIPIGNIEQLNSAE